MKIVLESPLSAPDSEGFLRNVRYAAWCARVLTLNGHTVWAPHLYAPHFLDDRVTSERCKGMHLTIALTDDNYIHLHSVDFAESRDMAWSKLYYKRRRHGCISLEYGTIRSSHRSLTGVLLRRTGIGMLRDAWDAFQRGESPPCTPGFELGTSGATR